MRCPNCGSLDTKRKGKTSGAPTGLTGSLKPLQRFLCRSCETSFTVGRRTARPRARFANDVVLEAVRLYVQGLASYRVLTDLLSNRIGRPVSRFTLNTWVDDIGARAKTPLEVSAELAPKWGGFLGVDGKSIWVAGKECCLLIAVDHPTQDIVHALVVEKEGGEEFARLVTETKLDGSYPLKGLVTDHGTGFVYAHECHFPVIPLQLCRVHLDRRLDSSIPKLKHTDRAGLQAEFRERIRSILYADSYEAACQRMYSLSSNRARYAGASRWSDSFNHLQSRFNLYMTHHLVPGLPPDTNVVENVIKQLAKKLRLMEGFATVESADRFCRLLVACYRFKRFTDSRNGSNGLTPLEAAGAGLSGRDWLTCLLER